MPYFFRTRELLKLRKVFWQFFREIEWEQQTIKTYTKKEKT